MKCQATRHKIKTPLSPLAIGNSETTACKELATSVTCLTSRQDSPMLLCSSCLAQFEKDNPELQLMTQGIITKETLVQRKIEKKPIKRLGI